MLQVDLYNKAVKVAASVENKRQILSAAQFINRTCHHIGWGNEVWIPRLLKIKDMLWFESFTSHNPHNRVKQLYDELYIEGWKYNEQ